jgi:hypothetical protein
LNDIEEIYLGGLEPPPTDEWHFLYKQGVKIIVFFTPTPLANNARGRKDRVKNNLKQLINVLKITDFAS